MQKHQILKIYGTDYKGMTKRLLTEADLKERIPGKEARIGIKPNLLAYPGFLWGDYASGGGCGNY